MMSTQIFLFLAAIVETGLHKPLQLVVEPTASGVEVMIIGDSDAECVVQYELSVQGGKSANNRSIQSGKARLMPSQKVVVAKTSLGLSAPAAWDARLKVKTCEGTSYELSDSSRKP